MREPDKALWDSMHLNNLPVSEGNVLSVVFALSGE